MSNQKRYGDPDFGKTLADLKQLSKMAATMDGVSFEGPAQKVGAILACAGSAGDLIDEIERQQEAAESLGDQIEKLLNLEAALDLPMPNELHVQAFREALPKLITELRKVNKDLTGDDPWEI